MGAEKNNTRPQKWGRQLGALYRYLVLPVLAHISGDNLHVITGFKNISKDYFAVTTVSRHHHCLQLIPFHLSEEKDNAAFR